MANYIPLLVAVGLFFVYTVLNGILAANKLSPLLHDMLDQSDGSQEMKTQFRYVYSLRRSSALFLLAHLILGVLYLFLNTPVMRTILFVPSIVLFVIEVAGLILVAADKKMAFLRKPAVLAGTVGLVLAVIAFVVFFLLCPEAAPFIGKGA